MFAKIAQAIGGEEYSDEEVSVLLSIPVAIQSPFTP